jgi:hypothetical protein
MHTDCSTAQCHVMCAVCMDMRACVSGPTHVWGAIWDCHALFFPMVYGGISGLSIVWGYNLYGVAFCIVTICMRLHFVLLQFVWGYTLYWITICMGLQFVLLQFVWGCILYCYNLYGVAFCIVTICMGLHFVLLQFVWGYTLYCYNLYGVTICMVTFCMGLITSRLHALNLPNLP